MVGVFQDKTGVSWLQSASVTPSNFGIITFAMKSPCPQWVPWQATYNLDIDSMLNDPFFATLRTVMSVFVVLAGIVFILVVWRQY